ncbi:MAG: sigma-70 region 4 domain-containing protein, partial [bacterium]
AKVLEMKYVEGYSSREIAEKLETSDEATQSMLARARQAFREVCNQAAPHLVPVNSPNAQ